MKIQFTKHLKLLKFQFYEKNTFPYGFCSGNDIASARQSKSYG